MNRLARDGWFQMFAAVAGLAMIVSVVGSVSSRRGVAAPAPASAPGPVAAPVQAQAVAPAAADPREERITPLSRASSSDLATYSSPTPPSALSSLSHPGVDVEPPLPRPSAPAPAAAPPNSGPAPKMTLTGAGVGNQQGIVGAPPGGGGLTGFLNNLMGRPPAPTSYSSSNFTAPAQLVVPAKPGVFAVDAAGGGDTASLRDAAYSAKTGDLIVVKPGTYGGPVEVAGKKIRIRGVAADPGAVTIKHAGRGAAIMVRDAGLELDSVRVLYGSSGDYPPSEPHGALYASGSEVVLRKVELGTADSSPALIAEQGGKTTKITVEGGQLMGGVANAIFRGPVRAQFTRTYFDEDKLAVVAWLDASVELVDCRFNPDGKAAINAYEGARATVTGEQRPRVDGVRGSDATTLEQSFGSGSKAALARGGFSRDIFRRGRKPGTIP